MSECESLALDAALVHAASGGALALRLAVPGIAGAGRGLVAARALRAGEVLLRERALLWLPGAARAAFTAACPLAAAAFLAALHWRTGAGAEAEAAGLGALAQLCAGAAPAAARAEASLRRTLALPAPAPLPAPLLPALAARLAVDANAFACAELSVVALAASLLNHSCQPNAAHRWVAGAAPGAPPRVRVVALTDIAAGDDVCTRYIDVEARPRHARKALLRARYGFDCGCVRCAAPSARGDDAVRVRCPACGAGFVLGGARLGMVGGACSACAAPAAGGDDALDDRADLLRSLVDARGDAAAAAAAVAGLKRLLHESDSAMFRVLFNEAVGLLRTAESGSSAGDGTGAARALEPLAEDDDGENEAAKAALVPPRLPLGDDAPPCAAALAAHAITRSLVGCTATMPHLQPSTVEAVLAVHMRACAAAGEEADATAEHALTAVRRCLAPLRADKTAWAETAD